MTNRMRVLVAYDGSECADAALSDLWNAGLRSDTRFKVLSVVEHWLPHPSEFERIEHIDHNDEHMILAMRAATRLRSMFPDCEVDVELGAGSPATAIIEKADAWAPDLTVVGSHGRMALGRFFFGSVSQKVSHDAHCSVRVCRGHGKEPGAPVRIMIAFDGSQGGLAAFHAAAARDWPKGSEARVVNAAWTVPPDTSPRTTGQIIHWFFEENARVKAAVDDAVGQLNDAGLKAEAVIKEGAPPEVLLAEAESWDADTIFLGARGKGRLERFLIGSVSSAVVSRAHCSVEVSR
jgi:nucleotide-binding universal stress UspA family protein